MKPKALFKDQQLQEQINEKGFVTLPFIGESELEELRSFYAEIHPEGAPGKIDGIHMTTWCEDFDYKMMVANRLAEIYKKTCEEVFENYRTLNNVFIVKNSGETPFKVHQDWNVVDEKENFAINVWIPLHDITVNEGGLWVVEGSHNIDRHVRGSAYLFPNYAPFNDELEKAAKSVSLKAGEAIVFYVNIIHGSPSNYGESERIASCFTVIPKNAPLNIYFQKQEGDPLEIHEPNDDFVYHYKHLRTETFERAPTNQPVNILPSHFNAPIQESELESFLAQKTKSPWWKFISRKN
ncbi:MAG: hypothetical protein ACJA0U_003337 [Salibacteraceae bacterium]|jgi:hypothetical protein